MNFTAALLLLAPLPMLLVHFQNLWNRPHYQFFPLFLLGAAWILWKRVPRQLPANGGSLTELALLSIGVLLQVGAFVLYTPRIAALGWLLVLGGLLRRAAGRDEWRNIWPTWAILWIILPPPFSLDMRCIQWLQRVAAAGSSAILDVLGVLHVMDGAVLDFPGRSLLVEEACSGIQSLFSLVAATLLLLVYTRRGIFFSVLMLAATVFWACMANISRIAIIAIAYDSLGVDIASGWRHEALGMVLFIIALGMLASTDALLRFVFGPITVSRSWNASSGVIRFWNRFIAPEKSESTQRVTMPVGPTDAFERRREMLCNRIFYAPAFWGAFVLLGLLQVVAVARMEIESPSDAPLIAAIESPEGFQRELFAGFRSDWELMDFRTEERDERSFWGRYSRVWEFDTPYGFAMISLDFPFHGYHPLDDCYRNTGWQLSPVGVFTPPMEEGVPEGPVYQFDMTKSDGQIGYVNFSVFDRDGELTRRGTDDLRPRLRERFQHSPVMWLAGVKPKSIDASSYQLQLFVSAPRQLTEAERQELRNHYVDALAHVLKHWEQHIVAKPSGE